jgi:6-phosphogluconate dehydrogenase
MKLAMIGLGRMGGNIALRLMRAGHEIVAYDRNAEAITDLVKQGAIGADGLEDLAGKLDEPAIYWVMLPAGAPTESTIEALAALARPGDIIIDGGNSFYKDDIRRSKALAD